MLTCRWSRIVAVAVLFGVALSLFGSVSPANAAARGSIHIHARICPTSMPAGANIFNQCHNRPGPDETQFKIDSRQSKEINAAGDVSFGSVTRRRSSRRADVGFPTQRVSGHARLLQPTRETGSGPNEAPINFGNQASFWVYVAPGSKLVCDVYFLPESGQ